MSHNISHPFNIEPNKSAIKDNLMKKLLIFLLCCAMIFCFTSCKASQDLDVVSDKLLISVLYSLENDDISGFTSLFLPSYSQSNRIEIEKTFNEMKEYYHGSVNAYAKQYTVDASTREKINAISKTQLSSFKPLNTSEASINQMYYVKTDKDQYLISFSWIQDSTRHYGITAIRILQYGLEISSNKEME